MTQVGKQAAGHWVGASWQRVQPPPALRCLACRWWCLLIVWAYVIFFAMVGVIFLKYVSFLKR